MDYVSLLSHQLEISPTVSVLSVVLDLLDDEEVESVEQLTVRVQPAEGEEEGVVIQQPDTEVSIVSDDGENLNKILKSLVRLKYLPQCFWFVYKFNSSCLTRKEEKQQGDIYRMILVRASLLLTKMGLSIGLRDKAIIYL